MKAPTATTELTDFPNRFSPMLVKELRQGLRTNIFTTSFILLQGFMVFTVFIGAASTGSANAASGFFWTFLMVTLLVAMPIRGFNALAAEKQNNSLDLLQLTRLSAWRITFGKWAALMSQTTLLVISILPYLVMRYFFGGIDLIEEFLILFFTFFASALFTALTVGFSSFPVLLRGFIVAATGFICFYAITIFSFSPTYRTFGSGRTDPNFWWQIGGIVIAGTYIIYFLLDFGAGQIASLAENNATRKRLISLFFAIAIILLNLAGVDEGLVFTLAGMVITLVWADALTERPSTLPSVLRPFTKSRLYPSAKYLLTPGWHTGILFLIFSSLIFISIFLFSDGILYSDWTIVNAAMLISLIGSITYPLIFIHLFFPKSNQMFALYILIQCCTVVISFILALVGDTSKSIGDVLFFCLPIPPVSLLALSDSAGKNHPLYFLLASSIFTLISLAIPLWRARPLYQEMRSKKTNPES
ncbi:MAG: hypothetical protein QM496_14650 [Verrucomicrobiota bacterium]